VGGLSCFVECASCCHGNATPFFSRQDGRFPTT
jgi:hypothetical protein